MSERRGVRSVRQRGRPVRRLRLAEIGGLAEALRNPTGAAALDAIRFMLLTGARREAVLAARWDAVDLAAGTWDGRPLGAGASRLLAALAARRRAGEPYLFPGRDPGTHLKDIGSAWSRLSRKASVAMWAARPGSPEGALVAALAERRGRMPRYGECRAAAETAGVVLPPGLTDLRLDDLPHAHVALLVAAGMALPAARELLKCPPPPAAAAEPDSAEDTVAAPHEPPRRRGMRRWLAQLFLGGMQEHGRP